jgi:hypothetical protein
VGLLGSLTGPKSQTQTNTTSTTLDPALQRYLQTYRAGAGGLFNQYQSGQLNPALQGYGDTARQLTSNLGFASRTGLGDISGYMDPYQQDVIGGVQADFANQRAGALNTAADLATKSGAFGGSRDAILRAQALRDVNQNESGTLANLRYSGFNDAAARLQADRAMAANLGLAGFQGQGNLGQFMDQRTLQALQAMQGGLLGGSNTTTTSTMPINRNPFLGALGGATTAYGMFGNGGLGIGGR